MSDVETTHTSEPPASGEPMTRSAFTFALGALVVCLGLGGLPEAADVAGEPLEMTPTRGT